MVTENVVPYNRHFAPRSICGTFGLVKETYCASIFVVVLGVLSSPVVANHGSGLRGSLVGFSTNGVRVMLREVDVQRGVQRFVVLSLETSTKTVHPVTERDDPERLEWSLRRTYGIESPGMVGPVAPDHSGALVWHVQGVQKKEFVEYRLVLHDGSGVKELHRVKARNACGRLMGSLLESRVHWSPTGQFALVVGHSEQSERCDSPRVEPIIVPVRWRGQASERQSWKRSLLRKLRSSIRQLESKRPEDALLLANQWLALESDSPKALATIARLHINRGQPLDAIATLWVLRGLPNQVGLQPLQRVLKALKTADVAQHVGFKALQWEWNGDEP